MKCRLCQGQGVTTEPETRDGEYVVRVTPCSCAKGRSISEYLAANNPLYRLPELEKPDDRARYS